MKKRLLILPLLAFATGALAGCEKEDPKPKPTPTPTPTPTPDPVPIDYDCKLPPEDCFGHKRITQAPEEGKEYYFGIYKKSSQTWMFINGEPHSDSNGVYPYYMSETTVAAEADFSKVAKVKVTYVAESTTKFNLQILKDGTTNDQKYISVYEANSSHNNNVMSVHAATEIGEKFESKDCYYDFEWITKFENYNFNTVAIKTTDARVQETEPTPKFFGTADAFISMDCAHPDKVLEDEYNVGYLYEVNAAEE